MDISILLPGDKIIVSTKIRNGKTKIDECKVVRVNDRFMTVDYGSYISSIDTFEIKKGNIVIGYSIQPV